MGQLFIGKMGDMHLVTYSFVSAFNEMLARGIYPLWNPYIFSGYPFAAAAASNVQLLVALGFFINDLNVAWNVMIVLNVFLAAFFAYLYVREMGLSFFPALVVGVIFAFVPSSGCYKDSSGFLLPLLFWCIERYHSSKQARYLFSTFFFSAFLIINAVPQYALYVGLFFGLYTLIRFKSLMGVVILIFAAGVSSFLHVQAL